MLKSIVFADEKNEFHYLYSFNKRELQCISIQLYDICNLYLESHLVLLTEFLYRFSNKYSLSEIYYAYSEFIYLKDNGFLDEITNFNLVTKVSPNSVAIAESSVRVITFEVTQRCNLQCAYCVYGPLYLNQENTHNKDLSFEKAKAVLDYFVSKIKKGSSVRKILTLGFYGGEPLLNFELIKQIVEYSKSIRSSIVDFEYTITTNALLLDKYLDFLAKNDFITLISLDGDYNASNYRITSNGTNPFTVIYNNIEQLKNQYPEYFKYRVSFNSVLHNKNSTLDTVRYINDKFRKLPLFSTLSSISVNPDKLRTYRKMYRSLSDDITNCKEQLEKDIFLTISPDINFLRKFFSNLLGRRITDLRFLLSDDPNINYIPTATCSPFSFKVFVSSDGKIHSCEKVGYKYSLGEVTDQNELILDHEKIADTYNNLLDKVKDQCFNCYNIYTCSNCIFESQGKCNCVTQKVFKKRISKYITELQHYRISVT